MGNKEIKITKFEFARIVDEILNEILGHETKKALVFHVCLRKGFREEEISDNIDKLLECLEELFGWASGIIFNEIMIRLKTNYNIQVNHKEELFNLAKELVKLR